MLNIGYMDYARKVPFRGSWYFLGLFFLLNPKLIQETSPIEGFFIVLNFQKNSKKIV